MHDRQPAKGTKSPPLRANRRTLLRTTGLLAAAAAMTADATASAPSSSTSYPDYYLLTYLLMFKYVTATYYLYAATGGGLSAADTNGNNSVFTGGNPGIIPGGSVLGGSSVPFKTPIFQQYANNIAADELTHVRFLRTVLGGDSRALAMPTIDMSTVWTNIGVAAKLIVPGQTFNPFADEISFLLGAYYFEDLCVSVESGMLSELSDNALIEYLGALSGTDAYHAGTIRTLLARIGGGGPVAKLSAWRASQSQTADAGILMPNGAVNIGPFGSQALMLTRSVVQGFAILFGGADLTVHDPAGGFFPKGFLA